MKSASWSDRFRQRLQKAGFAVRPLSPAEVAALKKKRRRRDGLLLATGAAVPRQVQQKNSLFPDATRRGKILSYGGLNQES